MEKPTDPSNRAPLWKRLASEPLLWFILLGALVYAAYVSLVPTGRGTILVESQTVRALERQREVSLERALTEAERVELIETFVDDEVLLREAYRRGIDRSDSQVRQRLLEVMRSSLEEAVAEPSQAQLEAYFRENIERYRRGEEVIVDHVFFSFGSEQLPGDPATLLNTLNDGADFTLFGEPSWTGPTIRGATLPELRQMLGSGFAEQVFAAAPGAWTGPVESTSGIHFVRVSGRSPTPEPSFDDLETDVRQHWELDKRLEIRKRKIFEVKKRYRIVIEDE